jgi:lactoylglutathione lyase
LRLTLTHIRLLVSNFAECYRFYKNTLELPLINGEEHGVYAEFKAGGVVLALFDRASMAGVVGASAKPADNSAQDRTALCLNVDDVDATAAWLKSRGVTLTTEPVDRPDWLIRTAHFRAPDGALLELNSPLKR